MASAEDDTCVDQALVRIRREKNMPALRQLLTAYVASHPFGYETESWKVVVGCLDVFASLPREDPGDVFAVLSLLLEAIESGGDPSPGFACPPRRVIAKVVGVCQDELGRRTVLGDKLWLMWIYHSPVRRGRLIELFVATGPDVVDRLRRTFSERVPQATSGLFFDENVSLDPLRGVRYHYALAVLYSHLGLQSDAMRAFQRSLKAGEEVLSSWPRLALRGGTDGKLEAIHQQSRSLLEVSEYCRAVRSYFESSFYLAQVGTLLLQNRVLVVLDPGYESFLELQCRKPCYDEDEFSECLTAMDRPEPAELRTVATSLMLRAESWARGCSDVPRMMAEFFDYATGYRDATSAPSSDDWHLISQTAFDVLWRRFQESATRVDRYRAGAWEDVRRRARVSELEDYAVGGREGSLLRGLVRRLDAISRSPPSDELRREWNSTMKDVGPHLPTKYFAAGLGPAYHEAVSRKIAQLRGDGSQLVLHAWQARIYRLRGVECELGNDLDRGLDDAVGRFLELFSRELAEEVALESLGRRFLGEEGRLARLQKGLHWGSVETGDQARVGQEDLEECIELFRSEGVAEIVRRLAGEGDGRAMHASLNPRAEFGIDLGGRSEKDAWIFPTVPGGLPPY